MSKDLSKETKDLSKDTFQVTNIKETKDTFKQTKELKETKDASEDVLIEKKDMSSDLSLSSDQHLKIEVNESPSASIPLTENKSNVVDLKMDSKIDSKIDLMEPDIEKIKLLVDPKDLKKKKSKKTELK